MTDDSAARSQAQPPIPPPWLAALGVSPEDLTRNRAGYMTEGQLSRLRGKWRSLALQTAFFAAGCLLAASLFLDMVARHQSGVRICLSGCFPAIFALLSVSGGIATRNLMADTHSGSAALCIGRGRKAIVPRSWSQNPNIRYYLYIGRAEFEIPKKVYQAVPAGLWYRVYYAPRSEALLSFELLPEANAHSGVAKTRAMRVPKRRRRK